MFPNIREAVLLDLLTDDEMYGPTEFKFEKDEFADFNFLF
jgi:hypothetical protein